MVINVSTSIIILYFKVNGFKNLRDEFKLPHKYNYVLQVIN